MRGEVIDHYTKYFRNMISDERWNGDSDIPEVLDMFMKNMEHERNYRKIINNMANKIEGMIPLNGLEVNFGLKYELIIVVGEHYILSPLGEIMVSYLKRSFFFG